MPSTSILGVCLVLTISLTSPVLGQNKVIEIDSVSGLPSTALPFDEPFVLKIPTKSTRINGVAYQQHIGRRDFGDSKRFLAGIKQEQGWPKDTKLINFDPRDYELKKIGTQRYLLIRVNNPNLLKPGKTYTFFWAEEVSDDIIDLFDAYRKIRTGDAAALDEASRLYEKLALENQKVFNYPLNFDAKEVADLTTVKNLYDRTTLKLPDAYTNLEASVTAFDAKVNTTGALTNTLDAQTLTNLAQEIVKRTYNFDYELRQKYLPSEVRATTQLYRLAELSKNTAVDATAAAARKRLLDGLDDINCNNCDPAKLTQYETRSDNLQTTQVAVDQLLAVAQLLANPYRAESIKAVEVLNKLQTDLRALRKEFDAVLKARKTIKNKLFSQSVSQLTTLGSNTYTYSFDTRNKLSIAPDFGVVTTRIGNDGTNPYAFVPYLGFHINFRPINRDVPFKSYNHTLGHRLSLMFGYSIVSVDNGPKLSPGIADSVSSFFSGSKGTLITGFGFRLGNAVRITTGYMWYFSHTSTYAAKPNMPLIYDQRRLQTWPFVGLSLDLALKDLLNGITDVFKGSPRRYYSPPPADTSPTVTN